MAKVLDMCRMKEVPYSLKKMNGSLDVERDKKRNGRVPQLR